MPWSGTYSWERPSACGTIATVIFCAFFLVVLVGGAVLSIFYRDEYEYQKQKRDKRLAEENWKRYQETHPGIGAL